MISLIFLLTSCADSIKYGDRTTTTYHTDGSTTVVQQTNVAPSAMNAEEAKAMSECFDYVDKRQEERNKRKEKLSDIAYVSVVSIEAIERAYGGGRKSASEICSSGTNFYDYMIADTKASNKTRREGLNVLKHFGYVGAGAYSVDKIMDAAGDKVGRDKIEAGGDNKIAGDDMKDASSRNYRDTEQHQTIVGDEDSITGPQDTAVESSEEVTEEVESEL